MTYPTSADWQALYKSIKAMQKKQEQADKRFEKERKRSEQKRKEAEQKAEQKRKEAEQKAEQKRKEAEQKREKERKEAEQKREQTFKKMKEEMDQQMKETWAQIKEQGKQIGGIGEKFGHFTEGMALPSMENILRNKFKMEVVSPCVTVRNKKTGEEKEIDVLAYANSDVNQVVVVEIKSKLRKEGIDQIKKNLNEFFELFPEHKGKQLFGIIAAIDTRPRNVIKEKVLKEGLYYAEISDDTFTLKVPKNFQAKPWK